MSQLTVICKSTSLPCFFWGGRGVIFYVILAVNTNVTVFWNVTPCGFISRYHHWWGMCRLLYQGRIPEDGSRNFLRNVSRLINYSSSWLHSWTWFYGYTLRYVWCWLTAKYQQHLCQLWTPHKPCSPPFQSATCGPHKQKPIGCWRFQVLSALQHYAHPVHRASRYYVM